MEIQDEESISNRPGDTGQQTTQSTKDRLKEAEQRIKELMAQLAKQQDCAVQALDIEISASHTEPAVTPEKARMTGRSPEAPTGGGH